MDCEVERHARNLISSIESLRLKVENEVKALENKVTNLEKVIESIEHEYSKCEELNIDNFTVDQVEEMNGSMIGIAIILDEYDK